MAGVPPSSSKTGLRSRLPAVLGAVAGVVALVALVWFIHTQLMKPAQPARLTPQVVQLVRPPPPPDEPPPPPPPEEIKEPIEQEQAPPDQAPAEAPPALGLDAEGVAGGDDFGLAAHPGGRDLFGTGNAAFAWYTALLKDSILDTLSEDERIRHGSYQVQVRVWLSSNGAVERIALTSTSGDRKLDAAIEAALGHMSRVREAPPIEMPQPVTLRIVSRG